MSWKVPCTTHPGAPASYCQACLDTQHERAETAEARVLELEASEHDEIASLKFRVQDLEVALDSLLFWQPPDGQEAIWDRARAVQLGTPPIGAPVAERKVETEVPKQGKPYVTCKHRDWTDDDNAMDAPFPSGDECGEQASFLACTPSVDTPVCCRHACRCRKPLAELAPVRPPKRCVVHGPVALDMTKDAECDICARSPAEVAPIPIVLHCSECRTRHIDEGDFKTKVHHTHSCQGCGLTWRPAVVPTVGVRFLPGFKNERSGRPDGADDADRTVAEAFWDYIRAFGSDLPVRAEHAARLARAVARPEKKSTEEP